MSNPENFHNSPSPFDNIDYSILDSANIFTGDPDSHCAQNLDSPGFELASPFEKDDCMDLETTPGNYEETIYSPNLIPDYRDDMFSVTESEQLELYDEIFKAPKKVHTFTITIEIDDEIYLQMKEKNSNSLEEETASVSTKDTVIGITKNVASFKIEGTLDGISEGIKNDWSAILSNFAQKRPADETNYLQRLTPHLMASLKETLQDNQQPLPMVKMLDSMIPELLYGKEMMLSQENEFLKNLVMSELDKVRNYRPKEMFQIGQEPERKRPEKKAPKGRKNHSNVNHMNENYVSNVFRFAKESFPEDKSLLKIASERGVSATGFRNLTTAGLNDDILVRKAKVRIVASGEELVSNIEYWMQDGFFENCSDKEKYMQYKQKAIENLALWRFY